MLLCHVVMCTAGKEYVALFADILSAITLFICTSLLQLLVSEKCTREYVGMFIHMYIMYIVKPDLDEY